MVPDLGLNFYGEDTSSPLLPGYDDVAGKVLKLDHILDADLRPLDELFRDHFLQAVLKHMKGVGEPYWDHEDALGDSWMICQSMTSGAANWVRHLEFEMAHILHGLQVAQEHGWWHGSAVSLAQICGSHPQLLRCIFF